VTKKTFFQNLIPFLSILIPLILIFVFRNELKNIENYIPKTGINGPLLSILFLGILSITPIPSDPIIILNGALFGPVVGIITSWMGNNLASLLEYFLAKSVSKITNFQSKKKLLPFGLDKLPVNSFLFLFAARMIPGFGGKFVSIAAGIYHVPIWRYIWITFLSNLLGAVFFALGGYTLLHQLI